MTYETKLLEQNQIQLLEPFTKAQTKHKMKCLVCEHEWSATPLSKSQTYKKTGSRGCPICTKAAKTNVTRTAVLEKLHKRGITILTDGYQGKYVQADGSEIELEVRNEHCGHEFRITAKNLITRGVRCSVCN